MANRSTVYICGCVRNVDSYLHDVFKNIHKMIQTFQDYHIIMSYDESNDRSLDVLRQLQQDYPNKMTIIIGDEPLTRIRTQNISNARNRILQHIRDIPQKERYEYFIMMDMDDVCADKINIDCLLDSFSDEKVKQWDALSFNRNEYYDIWALSIYPYTFSCWHYNNSRQIQNRMKSLLKKQLVVCKREKKLLQCISAFNGFSIYKTEKFIRNHYEWNVHKTLEIYPRSIVRIMSEAVHSDPIARHDDCEHRYFHISASQMNGSRICVSPNILFGVKQPSPTLFGLHRRMQR